MEQQPKQTGFDITADLASSKLAMPRMISVPNNYGQDMLVEATEEESVGTSQKADAILRSSLPISLGDESSTVGQPNSPEVTFHKYQSLDSSVRNSISSPLKSAMRVRNEMDSEDEDDEDDEAEELAKHGPRRMQQLQGPSQVILDHQLRWWHQQREIRKVKKTQQRMNQWYPSQRDLTLEEESCSSSVNGVNTPHSFAIKSSLKSPNDRSQSAFWRIQTVTNGVSQPSEKQSQMKSQTISGAIAASLPKGRQDVLLENIMKLEEIIRNSSKEENPAPDFSRLMRKENMAEEFKRRRKEAEELPPFEKIEMEIIGSSVEAMLKKINDKRHAFELAQLNQNFIKPMKYFDSTGAVKAQMHTLKKTLLDRQGNLNTTGQIQKLLSEFSTIAKHNVGSLNLIGANETGTQVADEASCSRPFSQHRKLKRPSSALYSNTTTTKTRHQRRSNGSKSAYRQTQKFQTTQKPSSMGRRKFTNLDNSVSNMFDSHITRSPKNKDLLFAKNSERSEKLSSMPQTMINSTKHRNNEPFTMDNTITHGDDLTTLNSPHVGESTAMHNINVNINFNVTGNVNIINSQEEVSEDGGANFKSSLRQSVTGINRFQKERRNQHGSVDFDVRFLKKAAYEAVKKVTAPDIKQEDENEEEDCLSDNRRKKQSQRPMSAAVKGSNMMFRAKALLPPKDAESSNMTSLTQFHQVGVFRQTRESEANDVGRHSSVSRQRCSNMAFLTQQSSKKHLDVRKKAERTFNAKQIQTVPLKKYFETNLAWSSIEEGCLGEYDDPKFKSHQKSIRKQAGLFEKIYYNNKHINAFGAAVDMDLEEQEPTLDKNLFFDLFNAKFADLLLTETEDQFNRFRQHCTKRNFNGRLMFTDMKLSLNFANTFSAMMTEQIDLRVIHINLERNHLRDAGAIKVVSALAPNKTLVSLNIASNEIKPRGINRIFEILQQNESIQELIVGSSGEGCGILNRVNPTVAPILDNFIMNNGFVCMLSLRGTGLTINCLKPLLERLREAYKRGKEQNEAHQAMQHRELDDMEERYRNKNDDGENTALKGLMKTKRLHLKLTEAAPIAKLALQSLDLANNDLRLAISIKKKFMEAITFSDLQKLDLSDNNLGNEGINVVASALVRPCRLRWLAVSNCGFTLEGGASFLRELGKNVSIEHAVVDKNNLSGTIQRQKVLGQLFTTNKKIKYISLAHCKFGATGANMIGGGIGICSMTLTGLNLAGNNIGDQGAEWFAYAFDRPNFHVKYLNLSENQISDRGGAKLCSKLKSNKTLQVIDLRRNELGEQTAKAFRLISLYNPMLTKVHLEFNLINLKHIEDIAVLTEANISRQDKRRHQNINKNCKTLKKEVSKIAFNRETPFATEEAFAELKEKLAGAKETYEISKIEVDRYEDKLLFYQQNPDKENARLKKHRKKLQVEQIDVLVIAEKDIDRRIKDEQVNFKETKLTFEGKFESNETTFAELERKLKLTTSRLAKKKQEYLDNKEKKDLVAELTRLESYLRTRQLKYDFANKELQNEIDRQEKQRRQKELVEQKQAADEARKKREEVMKKEKGGKKGGGKRKASASAGRSKKGKKGKKGK